MKLSAWLILLLFTSVAFVPARAEESTPPESKPASGGTWLKITERIHADPEHQVALVFFGEKSRVQNVWKVSLGDMKAVKLCDLPAEIITHEQSFDYPPKYAALSADGTTIYLDRETQENASFLPDGRSCLSSDELKHTHEVVALRRTIYALPVSGGKATALAKDGDFNEWTYDILADRVIAVASENHRTGLVVIRPDGKREQLVGFRPYKAGVTAIFGGQKIPPGGSCESSPVMLGERLYTCLGMDLRCYTRGSEKFEDVSLFKTNLRPVSLAPSPTTKELYLLAQFNGEAQIFVWTQGNLEAKVLGKPFTLFMMNHVLTASSDGSALWTISESPNGMAERKVSVQRVDPKTGQFKECWNSVQLLDLVAKAQKEAAKK